MSGRREGGPPLDSNLGATGEQLPKVAAAAMLGNLSQRKNRGRYADLPVPPAGNPGMPATVLELTGDDQLAAGIQVSCSIAPIDSWQPGQEALSIARVLGRVYWGTDGAQHVAEFDWIHGAVLSVAGSFCMVQGHILEDAEQLQAAVATRIGASVGYFPHSPPLRRTYVNLAVPAGDTIRNPVPPFARSVEVLRSPQAAVTAVLEDASGFPLAMLSTLNGVRFPLVPGTAQVAVSNMSLDPLNAIQTVFELWI